MGRLTANPELKSTTTGKSVTSFSIAVERKARFCPWGVERAFRSFSGLILLHFCDTFPAFLRGKSEAASGMIESRLIDNHKILQKGA